MSIKRLMIVFFIASFSLAVYLNVKYIQANHKQTNENLVKVDIVDISCSKSFRTSSNILVNYKQKEYIVNVSNDVCSKIEKREINPNFYYFEENDSIFYENQFIPFAYVYLTYICSLIIPLLIYIFYRKELNNNISTM